MMRDRKHSTGILVIAPVGEIASALQVGPMGFDVRLLRVTPCRPWLMYFTRTAGVGQNGNCSLSGGER